MKFLTFASLILATGAVATQYPFCDKCEVIYTDNEDGTKYGVENQNWCKINIGKCAYPECPNCDAFHVDQDGLFGTSNNDWCYMAFDKCNSKLPTCKTCKIYGTYNKVNYGQENKHLCKIDDVICAYAECPNCDAVHVDQDGVFGINNGDWCRIPIDKCNSKLPKCKTCNVYGSYDKVNYGQENGNLCKIDDVICAYAECPNCDAVHVDQDGVFGINNGDWCRISIDKCNNKLPKCKTCNVYGSYNKVNYGQENGNLCKIDEVICAYPECQNCDAVHVDQDGVFGIYNGDWCRISIDKCNSKLPKCKTCNVYGSYDKVNYGQENGNLCKIDEIFCNIPKCKSTCEVMYTDEDGDYGIENDDWCVIDKKNCKN
eukprot:jgi/Orpsp1_1/1182967/evm.model.c7180000083320.1